MPLTGEFLAPEDFRKARKSLLIVATTTIVVAGLNITGNGAEVLGLTVDVSQREIVFLEQVLTALLCFLYLLKVLPEFCLSLNALANFNLRKSNSEPQKVFMMIWATMRLESITKVRQISWSKTMRERWIVKKVDSKEVISSSLFF